MRRRCFLLVVAIGVLLSCGADIAHKVTIDTHKIVPFENLPKQKIAVIEASDSKLHLSSVAEIISMTFMEHGFNIVEQTYVRQVLRENHIVLSGERDLGQIQKVGKILKADKILLVSVTEFTKGQKAFPGGCASGPSIVTFVNVGILARLIEVKGAQVLWTGIATTQDVNLHKCLKRISNKLARRLED